MVNGLFVGMVIAILRAVPTNLTMNVIIISNHLAKIYAKKRYQEAKTQPTNLLETFFYLTSDQMKSKGIAINATYVVVIIVVTVGLIFGAVALVADNFGEMFSRHSCERKFVDYCDDWWEKDVNFDPSDRPYDWDKEKPENCEEFEIYEPTPEECIDLIEGD